MEQKVSVILLCGGLGARMKTGIPKQFLEINQKIIAYYSFEVFSMMPEISEIVVVCDPLFRHYFNLDHRPEMLSFALPGPRRQDSVFNGFKRLQKNSPLICIHDSARPFITPDLVRRVIKAANEYGASTVGMPIKFTLKEHDGNLLVKNTLDRTKYWEIQTPQVINHEILKKGFDYINHHQLEVTDDVSLVERLGYSVKLVEGCYSNIKITTPDDLDLAEYIQLKKINYGTKL